jgi:hypothetical protein
MTLLGKILVFVNLVLSLGMAAIALGIYTNHIDWPAILETKDPQEVARTAEVTRAQQAVELAARRLDAARATLAELEQRRPANQKWYDEHLALLESGKGPLSNLVYDKNGKLQVDPKTELPVLAQAPGLRSRKDFLEGPGGIAETEKLIQDQMKKINDDVKIEEELTKEINGDKGKEKGLRDLLREEQQAAQNARGELEYLRPLRYNRNAELGLLLKRQQALKARRQELQQLGTTAALP